MLDCTKFASIYTTVTSHIIHSFGCEVTGNPTKTVVKNNNKKLHYYDPQYFHEMQGK